MFHELFLIRYSFSYLFPQLRDNLWMKAIADSILPFNFRHSHYWNEIMPSKIVNRDFRLRLNCITVVLQRRITLILNSLVNLSIFLYQKWFCWLIHLESIRDRIDFSWKRFSDLPNNQSINYWIWFLRMLMSFDSFAAVLMFVSSIVELTDISSNIITNKKLSSRMIILVFWNVQNIVV